MFYEIFLSSGQCINGDTTVEVTNRLTQWFMENEVRYYAFNDGEGDTLLDRQKVEAIIINPSDKNKRMGF